MKDIDVVELAGTVEVTGEDQPGLEAKLCLTGYMPGHGI